MQSKELFDDLSKSKLGKDLVVFLREFQDSLADIRNQPKDISKEHVVWFIEKLEKDVVEKITLHNQKKKTNPNQYA